MYIRLTSLFIHSHSHSPAEPALSLRLALPTFDEVKEVAAYGQTATGVFRHVQ